MYKKTTAIVLFLLLLSCSKENSETIHLKEKGLDVVARIVDHQVYEKYQDALNFQNSKDFAGIIHNDILDELINEGKDKTVPRTEDEKINQTIEEVSIKLSEKYSDKGIDLGKKPSVDEIKFIVGDAKNFYSNVIEKSTILNSLETQIVTKDFFSSMAELSSRENLNYNIVKSKIENFEKGIMENAKLSSKEKDHILKATSIARNSFYYWEDKTVLWEPKSPETTASGKGGKWWKWILVTCADVAGYIAEGSIQSAITASNFMKSSLPKHSSISEYNLLAPESIDPSILNEELNKLEQTQNTPKAPKSIWSTLLGNSNEEDNKLEQTQNTPKAPKNIWSTPYINDYEEFEIYSTPLGLMKDSKLKIDKLKVSPNALMSLPKEE